MMRITQEELKDLIAAAKAGSRDAIGALLEHYRPMLVKKARSRMSTAVTVKVGEMAMVQEALLAAIQTFADFKGVTESEIAGWLSRILQHRVQDINRQFRCAKRDAEREIPLTQEIAETLLSKEVSGAEGSDAVRRRQAAILRRTFKCLPEQYRLIVWLHFGQRLPFRHVARHLRRSVDAVKKLWRRALRRWHKQLVNYGYDPGGGISSRPGP